MLRREFLHRSSAGALAATALCVPATSQATTRRAVAHDQVVVPLNNGRLVLSTRAGEARAYGSHGEHLWRLRGLNRPVAAATHGTTSYICDAMDSVVLVVDARGVVTARWTQFNTPSGIVIDENTVYVSDRFNHQIVRLDLAGRRLGTVGTDLNAPSGLAMDGDRLWVADSGNSRVVAFQRSEPVAVHRLEHWVPRDVAVDALGQLHVASALPTAVHTFSPRGRLVARWQPEGLPQSVSQDRSTLIVGVA